MAVQFEPVPAFHAIPRAPAELRIDGVLSEWDLSDTIIVIDPTLSDAAITHHNNDPQNVIKGVADLSARAALAWDDQYLYIAAEVVDDDLNGIRPDSAHNAGPAGWACDSVMFLVHSFRHPLNSNTPYSDSPFLALRYEAREGGRTIQAQAPGTVRLRLLEPLAGPPAAAVNVRGIVTGGQWYLHFGPGTERVKISAPAPGRTPNADGPPAVWQIPLNPPLLRPLSLELTVECRGAPGTLHLDAWQPSS